MCDFSLFNALFSSESSSVIPASNCCLFKIKIQKQPSIAYGDATNNVVIQIFFEKEIVIFFLFSINYGQDFYENSVSKL